MANIDPSVDEQLESALRQPEPSIGDGGFTETLILTATGFVVVVAVPLGWLFRPWIMEALRRGIEAISPINHAMPKRRR